MVDNFMKKSKHTFSLPPFLEEGAFQGRFVVVGVAAPDALPPPGQRPGWRGGRLPADGIFCNFVISRVMIEAIQYNTHIAGVGWG